MTTLSKSPARLVDLGQQKRQRRTRADIARLREALYDIVEELRPATVRQVFYQAVARGLVEKSEREYKGTVVRLLGLMRIEQEIPYDWIADETRWQRKPRTYSSLEQALESTRRFYRRALWDEQDCYVEIWLEKDALAGVVFAVTAEYDVPLMVSRGYASLSFLASAAEAIDALGKPAYLYQLGDHDPSGCDIPRAIERRLRELAPEADIHFERLAVTEGQIEDWNLPTRPTKKKDTRAGSFKGESVEVDAIPPDTLRELVRSAIESHIDSKALRRTRRIEAQELATFDNIITRFEEMDSAS